MSVEEVGQISHPRVGGSLAGWVGGNLPDPAASLCLSGRYLCVAVSAGDPEVLYLGGGVQQCVLVDSKLLVHLRHCLLWVGNSCNEELVITQRKGHGGGSSSNITIHVAPPP